AGAAESPRFGRGGQAAFDDTTGSVAAVVPVAAADAPRLAEVRQWILDGGLLGLREHAPVAEVHHVRLIVVGGRRGVCPEAERGDALPDLERVARWERRQLLRRVNEARQLLDGREPPALAPGCEAAADLGVPADRPAVIA